MYSLSDKTKNSNMDLSPPNVELQEYPLIGPWNAISSAGQIHETADDGLSDLFEGTDSDILTLIDEAYAQGDGNRPTSPKAPFDLSVHDPSVFGELITNQISQDSIGATVPLPRDEESAEASQQLCLGTSLKLGAGTGSTPAIGGWPGHISTEVTDQHARLPKGRRSLNTFSSPPQIYDDGYPSAPVSFSSDEHSCSQSVEIPRTGPSVTQEEDTAQQTPATPKKHKSQQPAQWRAFSDARSARIWMLKAENGPSAASCLDLTIPRTLEQKRVVADKLRTAFESAKPPMSEAEFLLLDWTCLELVDEVCLFHHYGSLTQRYLGGMPKHGPAHFDTYSKHIDALVAVIGRQNCSKATNLRKRMMDVTHRKRLIDNPLAELGTIEKNVVANTARKLREQERKAKAARVEAAEVEVANLKSQLNAQWSPATRGFITPSRPSAKLSAIRKASFMAGSTQRVPSTPSSTFEYSQDGFGDDIGFDFAFAFEDTGYEPTLIDTHGPSAAKKARHGDYHSTFLPQTPSPVPRAAVSSNMNNARGYGKTPTAQMQDPFGTRIKQACQTMQQVAHVQQSRSQGAAQRRSSLTPESPAAHFGTPSRTPSTISVPQAISRLHDATFMENYAILLSGLSLEQIAEAGRLRLDNNEYAYRLTLETHGLPGGLNELF